MRIVYLSDLDLRGSGYLNLSLPLCSGLASLGHEVRAIGLGYHGEEHPHNFSIIPAQNMQEAFGILQNLNLLWKFDVLIVAMDIPVQEAIIQRLHGRPFRYVGIMPVEADPLCTSWAMVLAAMDKPLIISEFGTLEAHKAGILNAEHLRIGIDAEAWRPPTENERKSVRLALGIEEDCFAVLTVADNQERKNLSKSMEVFAEFSRDKPNTKYILVTREHNPIGWRLRDYAQVLGIQHKLMIYERGMGFKELWGIYAAVNCFMNLAKAEGLCLPAMEALAVGIPVIGTNCTGLRELLSSNRGFLVDPEYIHTDPFGNGHRYWASNTQAVYYLNSLYAGKITPDLVKARQYVEGRPWSAAVSKLDDVLSALSHEQKTFQPAVIEAA